MQDARPGRKADGRSPHRAALVVLTLAVAAPLAAANPSNARSPLGINVRDVKYWGTELLSVDFFKRAGGGSGLWLTQNGTTWDTQEQAKLDLDSQGWPRSLPSASDPTTAYRYVTALVAWGTNRYPAGPYTVLWDGEGTLGYVGAAVRNPGLSRPNADVVDVTPSSGGFGVSIRATDPNHTGSYVRNIRVIAPGGTCNGDPTSYASSPAACPATYRPFTQTYATEPFHPLLLSDLKRFSTLRFIHFTGTNTTMVEHWSQRVQPDVASWGAERNDGAPYEAAFDLANTLDASPWLNVPARADDDYVLRMAQLARSRLTTRRPIWVEYNNETWNGAYPYSIHALWMQQRGLARWPASPLDPFSKQMNWFGMRSAEVCSIWKGVFADLPGRVKCVMGSQSGNTGASTSALDCPLHAAEPGALPCRTNMDALAIGLYIGDYISNSVYQPAISSWLAEPDGGVNRVFDEINTGLLPRAGNPAAPLAALAQVRMAIASQVPVAGARNLMLVAYEGGSGLDSRSVPAGDPLTAYYAALQGTFVTAGRDPRIGAAFQQMLSDWKEQGGALFNVFSSAQAWSQVAGNAAVLEYEGQDPAEAPKYAATQAFIEANPCWWTGCAAATASSLYTITPCRAVDTRSPADHPISGGTMTASESRTLALPSSGCGIPSNATAYSVNVTVVPPGPLATVTLWASGEARPITTSVTSPTGRTRANAAIVPAGASGAISAFVSDATDLVLDVNGYFAP